MTDWRDKLLAGSKAYGDGGTAGKAARRIWRGLGFRNIRNELGLKETELGIYDGGEEDDLTRVLKVWHWYLDRVESPTGTIMHHAQVTADPDDQIDKIVDRLSRIPEKAKTGRRLISLSTDHIWLVLRDESALLLPRPVTLYNHRLRNLCVCQCRIEDFVSTSIKKYAKVVDDVVGYETG